MPLFTDREAFPPITTIPEGSFFLVADASDNFRIKTADASVMANFISGGVNLAHHYRANLNKENFTGITASLLSGGTLPAGVTITYDYSGASGSGFYSIIRILGWDKDKVFIPMYSVKADSFDDYTKMHRFDNAAQEVLVFIDYSFEDFTILNNFPFEIYFYN